MKAIIFLAILGLALAGLRGDRRRVPHSVPHHHATHHATHHTAHHATHHASKTSGHGHGHGNSNSENSEELFSLRGAIENIIDHIKDARAAHSESTASTKSHIGSKKISDLMPHHHASKTSGHGHSGHGSSNSENSEELFNLIGAIQGAVQGTVDTIQNDLQGTADTITNAVESITPAEAAAAGNAIASGVGTGLKLGNSALQDVNDGLGIANAVIP